MTSSSLPSASDFSSRSPDNAENDDRFSVGMQCFKIVLGVVVMIAGLLYVKHVDMPTADAPYVAVMLLFLVLMMIGGALVTAGVQAIVVAAKS